MPDNRTPRPYWESTEYIMPKGAEKDFEEPQKKPRKSRRIEQYAVTPRTVGAPAPRHQHSVKTPHTPLPEKPRPVPSQPIKQKPPAPPPRRGGFRQPRTVGPIEPRKEYKYDKPHPYYRKIKE